MPTGYEELTMIARFLAQASPFATLPSVALQALARRLEPVRVQEGAVIMREGEPGDSCYLLRHGRLEVLTQAQGEERQLATLHPGTLVGEAALLTSAPRNATVRALEASDLLVLQRADLLAAMRAERGVGGEVLRLLRLRERPRRAPGVLAFHRTEAGGEVVTVLKDPVRGAYFRLSPAGWFIWQRSDGHHTLRDLTLDYLGQFGAFAPYAIAGVVGSLAAAGFLHGPTLRQDAARAASHLTLEERAALLARRALEWQVSLRGVDPLVTRAYRYGARLLFMLPAQALLAGIVLLGIPAFCMAAARASTALHAGQGVNTLLLFLIPTYLLSIILHEAGHALTTKHFGHEVPRVGVGWYWFGPIAFVDTSDLWLAGRWVRMAATAAGPYTNLVLAGLAAVLACLSAAPAVTVACWEFALVSYLLVLLNLNPLLEYDGYYLLMDWLDRPNLRRASLAWLRHQLPRALRTPAGLHGHRLEVLYGAGSLLYVAGMAVQTVIGYRLLVETWLARVAPAWVAAGLAWVLAGTVVILSATLIGGELRPAEAGA